MPVEVVACWLFSSGLCALGIIALLNYFVDPAQLFHRSKRPIRSVRARKLVLLHQFREKPVHTLLLGSSRTYNLNLAGESAVPAPVFNLAVTTAHTEDYLVCFNYLRAHQSEPLQLLVIACEPPALHPTSKLPWEAYISQAYSQELEQMGALKAGPAWRWFQLLSFTHTRESANEMRRRYHARRCKALHKFQWNANGFCRWIDNPARPANARLTARQLRAYPRTGLNYRSFTHIGDQRARWLDELLRACFSAGTHVLVYIPPEHPKLVSLTDKLSGGRIYPLVSEYLSEAVTQANGVFLDWHDPASLGFTEADFRDAIHLRDSAQEKISARLAQELTRRGWSREDDVG